MKDKQFNIEQIKLIVGLGNPTKEFKNTRHNVGFMFLDYLATNFSTEPKFKAEIASITLKNKLILAKPITYMNSSGESVQAISQFYKLLPENILIVHDDLDIKLGESKLQFAKGPKIHNGILSIENLLSSSEFWRLRIGIDNRSPEVKKHMSGADYVLNRFSNEEQEILNSLFEDIKTRLSI